jgi:hypothetical protein
MDKYLAIWGQVNPPPGVSQYGSSVIGSPSGLQVFISVIVKSVIVFAGLYAFFNIIIAGYSFMSAGGNPEKITAAWAKIWQTLLGLFIAAGAFVLAGIFGHLIFGNYNALLQLSIFGPT